MIFEESGKHDYGCAMLFFKLPELAKLQKQIDPQDIYKGEEGSDRSYGMEDNPHVTLLYGLHEEVTLDQVKNVLDGITFSNCKLFNISKFDNPLYDVLKFDVGYPTKGEAFLTKANKELKQFPNTNDYPKYHAHSTVGYLKKGTANKYIKMMKDQEYVVTPDYAVYSVPDGTEHKIKIQVKK